MGHVEPLPLIDVVDSQRTQDSGKGRCRELLRAARHGYQWRGDCRHCLGKLFGSPKRHDSWDATLSFPDLVSASGGQHRKYTGEFQRGACVDTGDASLGDGRVDDEAEWEIGSAEFGSILCRAGDLRRAIDAGCRRADVRLHKPARFGFFPRSRYLRLRERGWNGRCVNQSECGGGSAVVAL